MPKLRQHQIDARNALLAQGLLHCPKCSTTKPVDDFGKKSSRWSGRQEWCKPCRAEYRRTYKYDPAATAKRRQEQAELRKRDLKVCSKCRHLRCRSEFTSQTTAPDGLNTWCRTCSRAAAFESLVKAVASDPWHYRLQRSYHRAGEAGNHREWVTGPELKAYWESIGIDPYKCVYTGAKLTDETLEIDHLVGISEGGSHTMANLRPASKTANNTKRNKHFVAFLADRSESGTYEVDPETRDALLGVTVTNTEAV